MKKTAFNDQFLVKILLRDKEPSWLYIWIIGTPKTFWNKGTFSGWHKLHEDDLTNESEILAEGLIIEGSVAYNKPYVEFWYLDKSNYIVEFNTIEEAKAFYDKNLSRISSQKLTEI